MLAYLSISSYFLISMEHTSIEITIPAEFHIMFSKQDRISKKNLTIIGLVDETIETAVTRALKKNKIKCGDFDTEPFEKEQTLAVVRDRFAQLEKGRKLVIQCWSRKKTKKKLKEEEFEQSLIIQVFLQGQRPISLILPLNTAQHYEQTLKDSLEQSLKENRINCSIDDIKRIKIGQKKVWRKDHFLKKPLPTVKKEIGKEVITIQCVPAEG
jgi:hypothetical protein